MCVCVCVCLCVKKILLTKSGQNCTVVPHRQAMEDDIWWNTTYNGGRLMMEDDLWWKTTDDGRRLMMEDNLWWKTTMRMTSKTKRTCTGGRHMALDIFRFAIFFFKGSSHSRRLLFGIWTSHRSSNQMERLGLIWATYSPPHLKVSSVFPKQSQTKVF